MEPRLFEALKLFGNLQSDPLELLHEASGIFRKAIYYDLLVLFLHSGDELSPKVFHPGTNIYFQAVSASDEMHPAAIAFASGVPVVGPASSYSTSFGDFAAHSALPVRYGKNRYGALLLLKREAQPFDRDEVMAASHFAGRLAEALMNHGLYRRMVEAKVEWEETFKAVHDLVVVVDDRGRILRANRDLKSLYKLDVGEHTCSEVFGFCAEEEDCPAHRAITFGKEVHLEVVEPATGKAQDIRAFPVFSDQGEPVKAVLTVRDDTARKRIDSQLAQSAKLAAIGQMAAGIAHELNSPLTAVIGNANLLLRRLPEDERSRPLLTDIKECGLRCRKIISNLLTFSRQESFSFSPQSVNEAVEKSLELVSFQYREADVSLQCSLGKGLPQVLGNGQQLEQILVNLLLNAKHAAQASENRLVTVSTDFAEMEGGAIGVGLTVTDTGPGVPPENLSKIFDPFFTTKESEKGTGLGLSVSLGLARAHGGTIRVENIEGGGAAFTLLLPLMEQDLAADLLTRRETPGREISDSLAKLLPKLSLARKLGFLAASLASDTIISLEVEYKGAAVTWGAGLLTAAVLDGILNVNEREKSNLVQARKQAAQKGLNVVERATGVAGEFGFSMTLKANAYGGEITLMGTVIGRREPRLLALDSFALETPLEGCQLFFWALERPGLVGDIASLLAERGVRLVQMRSGQGGEDGASLAAFQVEGEVGAELIGELGGLPGISKVRKVEL